MTKSDKRENIIMIASEPLTFERGGCTLSFQVLELIARISLADWMEIKTNHMVVVTPKMNLLQIPIIDKYYVPPSDPASLTRDTEFAEEKGLLNPRQSKLSHDSSGTHKGPHRRQTIVESH